ncbi:MAG: DUF6489 family protein [Asticcacaulis sp.]
MKVTVNVECTPAEARAFLGLPNVEMLNDYMMEAMKARMEQNIHQMQPEEMLKSWSSLGVTPRTSFSS